MRGNCNNCIQNGHNECLIRNFFVSSLPCTKNSLDTAKMERALLHLQSAMKYLHNGPTDPELSFGVGQTRGQKRAHGQSELILHSVAHSASRRGARGSTSFNSRVLEAAEGILTVSFKGDHSHLFRKQNLQTHVLFKKHSSGEMEAVACMITDILLRDDKRTVQIVYAATSKEHQRQGMLKTLLRKFIEEHTTSMNVVLLVDGDAKKAQNAWKRVGFESNTTEFRSLTRGHNFHTHGGFKNMVKMTSKFETIMERCR